MKVGINKSSETRKFNDGITVRKSLLWHLTIYNMPIYSSLSYAAINAKLGIFSL